MCNQLEGHIAERFSFSGISEKLLEKDSEDGARGIHKNAKRDKDKTMYKKKVKSGKKKNLEKGKKQDSKKKKKKKV